MTTELHSERIGQWRIVVSAVPVVMPASGLSIWTGRFGMHETVRYVYTAAAIHDDGSSVPPCPQRFDGVERAMVEAERLAKVVAGAGL